MHRSQGGGAPRGRGGSGNGGTGGGGGRPAAGRYRAGRGRGGSSSRQPPADSIADAVRSLLTVTPSASVLARLDARGSSQRGASPSASDSSDSDFLLSGAEKREKLQRREEQQKALQQHAASGSGPTSGRDSAQPAATLPAAPRRHLPGYHFDAQRNKYFKILPSHVHAAAAGMDADDEEAEADASGSRSVHSMLHRRKAHQATEEWNERKRSKLDTVSKSASHLRQLHAHTSSRSLLRDLFTRQYFARCSPASIIQTHLPGLLRPVGFPVLHADATFPARCFTPFTADTLSSDFQLHVSAEHALDYDPRSRMLSVCGNRIKSAGGNSATPPAGPTGNGSFHSSFLLHPLDSRARSLVHPDDLLHALPFRAQMMSGFETNSCITSLHRIHSWPVLTHPPRANRAAVGTTNPLVFDSVRRLRQAAQAQREQNVWESEDATALADPVRHLIAYTTLGREHSTGLFRVRMEASYGAQPHVLFSHHISNGSVWTSAFPRSMLGGDTSAGLKVSLGCTKGGMVLDLVTGQRMHVIQTNKSDVLSQAWLETGGSDSSVLLNGSRDGTVRIVDTRARSGHGSSSPDAPSVRMSSSVCWLHPLQSNSHHVAAAAVDGQLCLYDLRRSAPTPSATSPSPSKSAPSLVTQALLTFHGHVDSFSRVKPHLDATERWLFCGGEDGLVRAWDVRHGQLQMEASPLQGDGAVTSSRTAPPRRIAWKHVLYIDEMNTLLAGSDHGVAAMTMHR